MLYGWGADWGLGGWLMMGFMIVVFSGLIAAVVVVLLHPPEHRGTPPAQPPVPPAAEDQALRILDERFSRGEIDEQEYRTRRELLTSR
jgi:putative membrane protein